MSGFFFFGRGGGGGERTKEEREVRRLKWLERGARIMKTL